MKTSVRELEVERHHIRQLIQASKKRLQQRELQLARHGINVDPQIPIEIDEISQRIDELEQRDLQIEQALIHMNQPITRMRKFLLDRLSAKHLIIGLMIILSMLFVIIVSYNVMNSVKFSFETDPVDFVNIYYDRINKRMYDEAFLMLSDSFKQINHCCNADGTFDDSDYVSYWNTIDSVRTIQVDVEYADQSSAILNVILLYTRIDNTQVEQNLRLYLVENISSFDNNNVWLINQAETIYNR